MTAVDGPAIVAARGQRRRRDWSDAVLGAYLLVFFAFMFAPLLIMVGAAFNDYPTPSITEWRGFTLRWFIELPQDARMMQGLWNSLMVAAGVLAIAIPLGLSGALVLSRLSSRATGVLYAILVSPMLTPGIILGITTMIFWRDLFGVQAGLFTAMVAQASFISSYVLLMFMARLSRQDRTLEEAAADLGASPFFTFRRITLPFLMPTIGTAALIALLQSIENYNTTFFAIGPDWTLVTEIGSRMRFGLSPIINAVGVIFITITVIAAATWALLRTRTAR
ncbi:ABC transporter permease [Acuticoccus sediminis]|uniref:ABC transporter permease n=1 Tax=Acuticoccus sediminis TaxID=2184697 RepID=A0A8B2NLS6_9HYPH|nr:ABC transporter permease [Acuticoccus sediminis]RAH99490.1 ABC transporter permease [Acuticoccus sediminis]